MLLNLQGNKDSNLTKPLQVRGQAVFFVLIPANVNGLGPDLRYIPVLKAR